ncbi:hypothetical protein Tco_0689389 [Tanacetum coccineum]
MSDPDPKPPNLDPQPKFANEFIRANKTSKNSISKPSHRGNKKNVVRMSTKSNSEKGVDDERNMEGNGDEIEIKEVVYVEEQDENRNEEAKRAKYNGSIKGGYNVNDNEMKLKEIRDVNLGNIKDVEMNENATIRKPLSFASVIKGLSNGGKNKLKYVPVITNKTGNKVVDMDRVVKESSKKWGLTLVSSEEGLMNVIKKGHSLVDQKNPLLQSWWLIGIPMLEGLGKSMFLELEYAWRPPSCSHYKVFGHCFENCKNMAITEEEVTRENDKKVVNDKKSIGNINRNKGCGFNGKGKSGMSNKGGYDRGRMGGVPKNSKEIPIPNEEMISWSTYERKIVEANRMVKTIAQEKANSGVEERMKSENMNRNQAFRVLYDQSYRNELAKIEELKWEKQMDEVDLFSALNLPLTDDVKSGWTEEMIEAFKGILEEIRNDEINSHWE